MPGSSEASLTSPPALVSSYKETANRALAHFRAELEDGKWIQLETNDVLTGVSVFKKKKRDRGSALSSSSPSPSPSSSHSSLLSACTSSSSSSEESFKTVSMYMGVGVVEDVSPEMIIGLIRKRELWDEWFQEGHRVASLDDETTISYMALKACSTLVAKERDIIIVEHKSNLPDKPQVIDYVTTSCIPSFSSQEDDSVQDPLLNVPIHPSRVRAHLTLGAWRLEFLKDYPGVIRTKISYVIQINVKGSVPKPLAKHYLIKRVTSGLGSLMKCAAALSSSWVPQSRLLLSTVANTSSEHLPLVGIANSLDASSSGEDSSRLSSVNLGEDDDASSSNIINNNNDNDPSSSSAEATPPALDSQFSNSTITRENSMTRDSIPASTPLLHSQSFSSLTTIFKTCGGSNTLPENEYTESRIAAFQYLHTLLANQWKFASEEQGVQISVMDSSSLSNHSPNIPVVKGDMDRIVSSHGSENATTKAINDWVNTVKCPEARKIWEPKLGFEEARVLEWFHSNECVFQSFQRGMFPVSGRDFVGLMSLFTHESSTYLITTSVLHPQAPESKSSQVRGHVHLAAWILTPTSSNCVHVTYIVHADPRGTIPARLVKFISTQTPLCVAGVRDYIEKYGVPMRFHVPVPPQEMLYCSLMREKSGRLAYECEFKLFIDSEAVSSFLIETEAAKKTKKRKQRLLLFQLNVDTRKMFYHGLDIQIFSSQTSDIVGNDESSLLQVLLSSDEQMVRFYLNADSNQKQLPVRSLIKLKACGGKIGSAKKCMVNGVEIEFDKLNSHFSTSNYTSSSSVLDDLDEAIDVINNDLLPKQKPSFTSLDGEKVEYKNLGGLETNAFVMEPESILASNQHSVNDNSNTNTPNNINNNNINNDDTLASSAKMKINTTKKYSPKIPKVFKSPVKGSFSPSALFSSLSRHAVRDVKLSSIVRRSIGGSVGGGASNNNSSQSPTSSSSSSPFNPSNACSMLIAASAVFGGSFGLHFSAFSYTFVGTLLLSRFFSTQIFPALDQLDRHDIVQAVVWWNISTFLFYVLTPSSSQHLVDLVLTTFVVTATVSLAVLERSRLSCVLKTNQLSPVHGFYALTWFFISSLAIWSGWVFSDSAFFLLLVVVSFYVCEIVDITNLISFLASSYRDHHHPNHHHHHHQISLADLMAAVGWSLVVTLCTSLVVGGKAIDATAAAFIAGGIVSFTHKTISSSGGNSLRLSISHFSDSMVNIGRIWLSSTHLNKVIVVSWFAAVSAMILAPVVCIKSFVYTCVILCNLSLFLFSLFTSPICGKIAGLTLVAAAGFQSAPMVLNLARHASKNHLAAAVIWFMVITLLLGTISGGVGRDMDVCSAVFILVCGILVASRQLNSFAVHIQSNDLALVAVCSVVTSGGLIVLSIILLSYVKTPYVGFLVACSSAAVVGVGYMAAHYFTSDPTIVLRKKKENPHPYLAIPQNKNIKLYAVNQKFEDSTVRKTF